MELREGLKLCRVSGGVYKDGENERWRLVPVDRVYEGKKKPVWYLQKIKGKIAEYQSGVFKTDRKNVLSADYKDELGVKHYLDIEVIEAGEILQVKRRAG